MVLKPKQMIAFLAKCIAARKPVLVEGAPGIGKSDVIDQARTLAGADLILSHPALGDPTDAKGLPFILNGVADFFPFGDLRRAMNATVPTLWFWDDFGQANPSVQASHMQLLLAREVCGHALSPFVTIMAATNRRIDRAAVSGILEPVKSRFVTIVELGVDNDTWCQWAIDHDIEPMVIAYNRFAPDTLSAFAPSADLTNSPSPRTWSHVSDLLKMDLPNDILFPVIAGAIGEGTAIAFMAFRKMWAELPNIDQILIDPASVKIPQSPATLYALATALAHRATAANFARVAQFVDRLIGDAKGEFGVLILRDCMQRHPEVTQTKAFVKLAVGELGQLIHGHSA